MAQAGVKEIVQELIRSEKFNAIAVLLYLRNVRGALTQDIRRILGKGSLANASYTRSVLHYLEEMGLIKYIIVSRHKVWQLTELGVAVSEELSRSLEIGKMLGIP